MRGGGASEGQGLPGFCPAVERPGIAARSPASLGPDPRAAEP